MMQDNGTSASADVPNLVPYVPAVWPFGEGALVNGHCILPDGKGAVFIRAVPDHLLGRPGDIPEDGTWDKCEGAPTLVLHFTDASAARRLAKFIERAAQAMEARQGRDADSVHDSAVSNADAPKGGS